MTKIERMMAPVLLAMGVAGLALASEPVVVRSPDGKSALSLTLTARGVELAAGRNGKVQATAVFEGQTYRGADDAPDGRKAEIEKVDRRKVDGRVKSPVYKKSEVDLAAEEATVRFKGDWGFVLHARNDGVAYRLFTAKNGEKLITESKTFVEYPSSDTACWVGANNSTWKGEKLQGSWQSVINPNVIGRLPGGNEVYYLPLVTENGGVFTAFTESDLVDYPGAHLVHPEAGSPRVNLIHAYRPAEMQLNGGRQRVISRHGYLARVAGTRTYPWRVFIMSEEVAGLAVSDAVWALATPSDPKEDFSWVKPGISSWDWLSGYGFTNVNFKVGINTETYLHYNEFAAEFGLPYNLIDSGWNDNRDVRHRNRNVDLERIIADGKKRGVETLLWICTQELVGREEEVLSYIASLGAAGVKVDWVDRDDQKAVAYVEKVSATAAKHHLVMVWHGIYKPTGMERRFPNVLNYEGVFGLESNRWSRFDDMPRNECQVAFTRMVAGPLDYTPGGMRNMTRREYHPSGNTCRLPTQGTRMHQIAQLALFFAPMQILADGPTAYRDNAECMKLMASLPTVWDDTVALPSRMGETAALARRKGDTWYIAAIGDWKAHDLDLPLDFLGRDGARPSPRPYKAEIYEDAPDADQIPSHWRRREVELKSGDRFKAHLAPGGGLLVRFSPLR